MPNLFISIFKAKPEEIDPEVNPDGFDCRVDPDSPPTVDDLEADSIIDVIDVSALVISRRGFTEGSLRIFCTLMDVEEIGSDCLKDGCNGRMDDILNELLRRALLKGIEIGKTLAK